MKAETLKRLDSWAWRPAVRVGQLGAMAGVFRAADPRPALVRPGGMGDLIVLTAAVEEMGLSHADFFWIIERRSEAWAKQLKLPYLCIEERMIGNHLRLAGRFRTVINTEQRFGLAQASARLIRSPAGGRLISFDTNLAHAAADVTVKYDADQGHEAVEFSRIIAAHSGKPLGSPPVRARSAPARQGLLVGIGGLQSPSRELSVDQWLALVEPWRKGRSLEVAASPIDREFAAELARRLGASVFHGDFGALCSRIAEAEEVFTIDSGFHHMASYYGVPTTTIFTSGRDRKWASMSRGSRILRRDDLSCQPCTWFGQTPPCPYGFACKALDFGRNLHAAAKPSASSVAQETKSPSQSAKP